MKYIYLSNILFLVLYIKKKFTPEYLPKVKKKISQWGHKKYLVLFLVLKNSYLENLDEQLFLTNASIF